MMAQITNKEFTLSRMLAFLFPFFCVNSLGKCAEYRPSVGKPTPDQSAREFSFFFPSRNSLSPSVMCEQHGIAAILRLLFSGSPTAILFAIWSVIVYAFQGLSVWARSHVLIELGKIVPFFANIYSSTTVAKIKCAAFVEASLAHRLPDAILWDSFRKTVRCGWRNVLDCAAAGCRVASQNIAFHVGPGSSAIADTSHVRAPFLSKGWRRAYQFFKSLTGKISHNRDHTIRRVSLRST